ncbi:MAG: hypothetical protein V5A27_06530 [Halapricum sp.]
MSGRLADWIAHLPSDPSPRAAREEFLRLIAEHDLADHEDIYEALARE